MRDLLEDFQPPPLDPNESARRSMRPLRPRFYKAAEVGGEAEGGFPILLDGRPIRTPARRPLAPPHAELAAALAAEWNAQEEMIDPARMPLTRLSNTIIDGVADSLTPVAEEIAKYLGSDLIFYRADGPAGLVALESRHWDPVLGWAYERYGVRFLLAEGVMFVAQPENSIRAISGQLPGEPWRLGALHSVMTLTGSALIALALAEGFLTPESAWAAAHVDEDWNMAQWGRDEQALKRRAFRWEDMQAAARVLAASQGDARPAPSTR